MRDLFLRVYGCYARFLYAMAVLGGVAAFIIMWLIDSSALTRKILNWPIPGSVEITESLMVVAIMLPMGYAQLTRAHLRVPLLTDLLPYRIQKIVHAFTMLSGFLFFAVMTWSAFNYAFKSFTMGEYVWGANVRFPLYIAKSIMCVGLFMLMLQFFLDFIRVSLFDLEDEILDHTIAGEVNAGATKT